MPSYGKTVGKLLELLGTGFLLGVIKSKKGRHQLFSQAEDILNTIDRKQLNYLLSKFKLAGLVKTRPISSNRERVVLTPLGRRRFQEYKFHNLEIKVQGRKWDKKWRMVLFDVPESRRRVRDALRQKLKQFGFLEFQKSVFVFPYPCEDEINFVINFFDIPDHVYCLETRIVPDEKFREHFGLN